jgi:cysteinyl-tRNA synthetase
LLKSYRESLVIKAGSSVLVGDITNFLNDINKENIVEKLKQIKLCEFSCQALECISLLIQIDIMDELGSEKKISNKIPESIEKLKQEVEDIKQKKLEVVKTQNYELAAKLRDTEKNVLIKLEEEKAKLNGHIKYLKPPTF